MTAKLIAQTSQRKAQFDNQLGAAVPILAGVTLAATLAAITLGQATRPAYAQQRGSAMRASRATNAIDPTGQVLRRADAMQQVAQQRAVRAVPEARASYREANRLLASLLGAPGNRVARVSVGTSNFALSSAQITSDIRTLMTAAERARRTGRTAEAARLRDAATRYAGASRAFFTAQLREALYGQAVAPAVALRAGNTTATNRRVTSRVNNGANAATETRFDNGAGDFGVPDAAFIAPTDAIVSLPPPIRGVAPQRIAPNQAPPFVIVNGFIPSFGLFGPNTNLNQIPTTIIQEPGFSDGPDVIVTPPVVTVPIPCAPEAWRAVDHCSGEYERPGKRRSAFCRAASWAA
jgi:hypothetical protein